MEWVFIGGLVLASLLAWLNRWNVDVAWRSAARQLRLQFSPSRFFKGHSMEGKFRGFPVKAERIKKGSGKSSRPVTRIVVEGNGRFPPVRLSPEGALAAARKLFTKEDVRTGDANFDETVRVQGPERLLVGMLSEPIRRDVLRFLAVGQSKVEAGDLWTEISKDGDDSATLVHQVQSMVALAEALASTPRDSSLALAANARDDSNPNVRLRNLELLLQTPQLPAAVEAARHGLQDASPWIRLRAAKAVGGDDGRKTLVALVGTAEVPSQLRAGALEELVGNHPGAATALVIYTALEDADEQVLRAAVEAVGRLRDGAALKRVMALASHSSSELAQAVARVLGQLEDSRAESALIPLLAHEDGTVLRAAAEALGRMGTVAAVEPLLPLTRGLLTGGDLKEVARDAVRRIQERLGSVEAGRVSLVEEHEAVGAVSLPPVKE